MTAGRKPLAAPEIVEPALDQPRIDSGLALMREFDLSEKQEQMSGAFDLGRFVGVAQLARTISNFSAAAEIRAFEEIGKSKAFKHLPIKHADGNFCPAENIDEFCRAVFGRGYKAMNNHKVMLQQLGEEAYENASRLNLNRSQLRLLLSMPEDERTAVEEAMRSESKAEVVSLIESLTYKLDEARAEIEDLKGEVKATEDISAEKSGQIDRLRRESVRIKALPPDQVLAQLQAEATRIHNDLRGGVVGQLRQALVALQAHQAEHGGASLVFAAGLVGQLAADLVALRDEFGLPEVDRGEHAWIDEA